MTTIRTVANLYAERLIAAKDKRQATVGILRRMSKLHYKGRTEPIPQEGKERIIGLIRDRVMESATRGTTKATYSTVIAYMLEQVRND